MNCGKIKLGISACLTGEEVRYDGGHKRDPYLMETVGRYVDWVPVCPETGCGLPVPREVMCLEGGRASPRLVTVWTGTDHTRRLHRWTAKKLSLLAKENLCGYVFKSRSPSCGLRDARIFSPTHELKGMGIGIFARAFRDRFPLMPLEDEERLHDQELRENFIERIFVYRRWMEYAEKDGSPGGLVAFHRDHKYVVMAHSQRHYSLLGRLVAGSKEVRRRELHERYLKALMEGLGHLATVKKNTNVLQHLAGYFKNDLSADEKRELQEVIASYRDGLVPRTVPVALLRHFVITFNKEYLYRQYYLNPHPGELMLRNHA